MAQAKIRDMIEPYCGAVPLQAHATRHFAKSSDKSF